MADQLPKISRIGIRVPIGESSHGCIPGFKAAAYDADTGVLLPAERVDLHMSADSLVTATITVIVAEVTSGG